jgi:hypothetical protein
MDSATAIDHDANHILNAPGRKTRHPVTQNPGEPQYRKLGSVSLYGCSNSRF